MVSFAFIVVAVIPIILGYLINRLYGNFVSSKVLYFFLFCIGVWEIGGAVLYDISIPPTPMLWLFRVLRIGCTILPAVFLHICYKFIDSNAQFKTDTGAKIYRTLVNKYSVIGLYIWSLFVFLIDLTNYGETGMTIIYQSQLPHYFPVYGSLSILFKLQTLFYLFALVMSLLGIHRIYHRKMKTFLKAFVTSTSLLLVSGTLCFVFNDGPMLNMVAIILFSIWVTFSFIGMYNDVVNNYNVLIDRQNRLDHVGSMTSSLIHEIKNSIMIIQGCSKVISSEIKLEGSHKEMMDCVIEVSDQLANMAKNYSDFFKNDVSVLQLKDTNCESLILKAQKNIHKLCNSDIKFSLETRGNVQAFVDEVYLHQVFINLFKNSFEAMPPEREDKRIDVILSSEGETLIIDVKDNGNGIPQEHIKKIFDPFNSTKDSGMGLGLTFCLKAIYYHKGSIEIVNSNSTGTHIQIQIPKNSMSGMLTA